MYPSMGTCLNYGPVLVMNYNTAANIKSYQNGTLILGTTHKTPSRSLDYSSNIHISTRLPGCRHLAIGSKPNVMLLVYHKP